MFVDPNRTNVYLQTEVTILLIDQVTGLHELSMCFISIFVLVFPQIPPSVQYYERVLEDFFSVTYHYSYLNYSSIVVLTILFDYDFQ